MPHKSGHQLLECWQPFHHHSNKEASHSEAVPARERVLAQAVVLEVQEWEPVWVWVGWGVLELALVAQEDH